MTNFDVKKPLNCSLFKFNGMFGRLLLFCPTFKLKAVTVIFYTLFRNARGSSLAK